MGKEVVLTDSDTDPADAERAAGVEQIVEAAGDK